MPIDVQADLRLVSQAEFTRVVYDAMAVFFEVHNELGRLFGQWQPVSRVDRFWKEWLTSALRDWGAGLDIGLYVDASVHALGGFERVEREIDVVSNGRTVGRETVQLTGPTSMMKVTGFSREPGLMEHHLRRFLNHTRLEAVHWVNITRRALTFRTLKRGSS